MNLSDLQDKDMVNLTDGKRIGNIIDAIVNNDGKLESLVVQKRKFFRFFSNNDIKISWNEIEKIGEDVILVRLK